MGDNGQTKEQILLAKKKRFEDNPDNFLELEDVVIAVCRQGEKVGFIVGNGTRREYMYAQSEVNYQITKTLQVIDLKQLQAKNIVVPGAGKLRNFLRNKK